MVNMGSRRRGITLLLILFSALILINGGGDKKKKKRKKPVHVQKKQAYATHNPDLKFDLYSPRNRKDEILPLVIFVHGGGWHTGNRKSGKAMCTRIALGGFRVAAIDYTLSDEAPFPAAFKDVKTAVRYFRANAKTWHVDGDRIGIIGASAGAHLAVLAAVNASPEYDAGEDWQGVSSRVQAAVGLWGPYDPAVQKSNKLVEQFLGPYTEEAAEIYREASPLTHVSPDDPPLLLVHGEDDDVVSIEHSKMLAQKYRQADLEVELIPVKNAGHGMKKAGFFWKPDPAPREIEARIIQFFKKHLTRDRES